MSDDWQPARIPEVLSRISAETRAFEPIDHAQWTQCSVKPVLAKIRRSEEYGDEAAFIVAREGEAVIFFDDAEDRFGGARLDSKGFLQDRRLYGELKHALRGFRRGAA